MLRLEVSVLVLSLVSILAPPAHAGGWWSSIGLEGQPVGIGEAIDRRVSEVMFDDLEEAQRARTRQFYAYLVPDFDDAALDEAMSRADPGDWWTPIGEPVRIGTVELFDWDANLAKARVRLEVPQVATGSYFLMLCDEGCAVALGNLIPSEVEVSADALAARTMRRLQKTRADLTLALGRARDDVRRTRSTLQQALAGDAEQIRLLGKQVARAGEAPAPQEAPWFAYAGWFFAGGAVGALLAGRRRSRTSRSGPFVERVPDDPRELTTAR